MVVQLYRDLLLGNVNELEVGHYFVRQEDVEPRNNLDNSWDRYVIWDSVTVSQTELDWKFLRVSDGKIN